MSNHKANAKVFWAVKCGKLPHISTQKCADCGEQAEHYDHRDYDQPLEVDPVCRKCNARRGPAIGQHLKKYPPRYEVTEDLSGMRHSEIIDLIGHTNLAINITQPTDGELTAKERVRNWKRRDRIPQDYWVQVVEIAQNLDIPITYKILAGG